MKTTTASQTLPAERAVNRRYLFAWVLCLGFYLLEYASRSSPGVMIPELAVSFGTTAAGVGALLGTYYYTYSVTSLVAGASLDRLGARVTLPAGLLLFGIGCLLFRVPGTAAGYTGRLLQGAGSAFAFTGAVYLASHGFPARWLATAIGVTHCLGMLGGFSGSFVVGPAMEHGIPWQAVWWTLGLAGLIDGLLLFVATPKENTVKGGSLLGLFSPYGVVFRNPQSYLCGLISGLLFVPTTIGAMTWGVALFQRDRALPYGAAVLAASMVPFGWVFGCPLLGWIADRIGRRKPVLLGGILLMLVMLIQTAYAPGLIHIAVSCFIFGVGSGAAMIPYTVMKEVNPDEVKASATGAINFLTFGVSALLGPFFGRVASTAQHGAVDPIQNFRDTLLFWIVGVAVALLLLIPLRETGHARATR
jgi:MFS family permease